MKKSLYLVTVIVIIFELMSCSNSRYASPAYGNNSGREFYDYKNVTAGNYDKYTENRNEVKKVIFSATLSLIIKHPDSANIRLESIAKKYNGYVTVLGTTRTIIRVKSEKLNDAIMEIGTVGKIDTKSLTGQDVTDEYLDLKIRLENAERSRERYLELLAKAENVEAALKVEKELERLNEVIDLLTGKMNKIDHLSAYSTITVNLKEKKKPGILGYIGIGLYRSVKWLFVRN